MQTPSRFLILLLVVAVSACGGESTEYSSEPVVQDSADRIMIVEGFSGPEAVRYDPGQDVYFVANFNGEASGDANGYISKVSAAGEILDLEFITGTVEAPLHGPRGMYIEGEMLWAADADGVHGFNRITGESEAFIDFSSYSPGFLNDVVITPDGSLYVTDTGKSAVYMANKVGEIAVAVELLPDPPNGITWDPTSESMVIAPWAGGQIFQHLSVGSHELSEGVSGVGGNYDGIEYVGDDFIVTSQVDSSLYAIRGGISTRIIATPGRPADIGIDTKRNHVAVPYIALDRVDIWALK